MLQPSEPRFITILGTPIGDDAQSGFLDFVSSWKDEVERATLLSRQDFFLLFSKNLIPRLAFALRLYFPGTDALEALDTFVVDKVRSTLAGATYDTFNVVSRLLISLPLREGGLGLLLPSLQSYCGFESSRWHSMCYLEHEAGILGSTPGFIPERPPQKILLRQQQRKVAKFLTSFLLPETNSRRLDHGSPLGRLWLEALPTSKRTTFSDLEFSAATADRLLLDLPYCYNCKASDCGPTHSDTCHPTSNFYIRRHETLKYIFEEIFTHSEALVEREPFTTRAPGDPPRDKTDISLTHQLLNGRLDLDLAVTSYGTSRRVHGAINPRKPLLDALAVRVKEKLRRYEGRTLGQFIPFVVATGGTTSTPAAHLLDLLHHSFPRFTDQLRYYLSSALAKGRAFTFLHCFRYHLDPTTLPNPGTTAAPRYPPLLKQNVRFINIWQQATLSTLTDAHFSSPDPTPVPPTDTPLAAP